ncbi:hypothetical protein G6F59_018508 [Rhizopus arrhizus]|nr:hypothetical protein G6F59_018508 [Rhizopus arrhizus]
MVQHGHERASEVASAHFVVVATDDERVANAVRAFGGTVIMTSPSHPSGTDRLGEVMQSVHADIYTLRSMLERFATTSTPARP